jgi:hypothetical protein
MGISCHDDILRVGPWCEALVDEYTSREPLMVPNGHRTGRHARLHGRGRSPVGFRAPEERNDDHIIAQGHHINFTLSRQVSSGVVDSDENEFDPSSILPANSAPRDESPVQGHPVKAISLTG